MMTMSSGVSVPALVLARARARAHGPATTRGHRVGPRALFSTRKKVAAKPSVAELLGRIEEIAGGKGNGTRCSEEEEGRVLDLVDQIVAQNQTRATASPATLRGIAGSTWDLVYTNSPDQSSGKLGPFVGDVAQLFPTLEEDERDEDRPEDGRPTYVNRVDLGNGLFRADLKAAYSPKPSGKRLAVEFICIDFSALGGLIQWRTPLRNSGAWDILYHDRDTLRILTTNKGNVFVLKRID